MRPPHTDRSADDAARLALACLDLTSLNTHDSTAAADAAVDALCERALATLQAHGPVAAVCVWPAGARRARAALPPAIAVAAVANFPDGSTDVERAVRDTAGIVQSGAQEVDVVLPWRALQHGDEVLCSRLLHAVRRACAELKLKVIIESGALHDAALIARASRIALDEGADFIKTSTGKTPISATPAAAQTMLDAIAGHAVVGTRAGFKASGGIRTVADAAVYLRLVEVALGPGALAPARFRIGASGLLDDIEAVLAGRTPAAGAAGGY